MDHPRGDFPLAAYPLIFPSKNLKIKGLHERTFRIRLYFIWLYFQDSKIEQAFPHFWKNSILCGIRWLGGIGENFRLTRREKAIFPGENVYCRLHNLNLRL